MFSPDKIRNVAIIAHGDAGKTSLVEAMLFRCGLIKRLGRVDKGTTLCDYDPEEIKRRITIGTSIVPVRWKEAKINILDTPGYADFCGDVAGALRAVDGAVVVICGVSGVEVGTQRVWQYADEQKLPRLVFINKLDKEHADFEQVLAQAKERLSTKIIPIQLPIGQATAFRGVLDLIEMKAFTYPEEKLTEIPLPNEISDKASKYREGLIEAIAETDDALLEKYLEGQGLDREDIRKGLRLATVRSTIIPLLCGSALADQGTELLLDGIVDFLPSPIDRDQVRGINPVNKAEEVRSPSLEEPFSALVFKSVVEPHVGELNFFRVWSGTVTSGQDVYNAIRGAKERIGQLIFMEGKNRREISKVGCGDIAAVVKLKGTKTSDTLCDIKNPITLDSISFPEPMISLAIKPRTKKDQERLTDSLSQLAEEDPTLTYHMEHEFGQMVISGMGELQLEVVVARLKESFGVDVEIERPQVPYRESIKGRAKAQGKYKKQTGGRGQYGDTRLEVEPLPRDEGFEFVNKIFGGAIPSKYIPAVEKGVREALAEGVLAGYPVVDVKVTLYDGSFHQVDSSDLAFKIAGSLAVKKCISEAQPVLLEPITNIEVVAPERYMGDVNGDLNGRRGRIIGIEAHGNKQLIKAQVPLAEMYKYATDLKSLTHGSGTYSMKFSHYEEVPTRVSQEIIAQRRKEKS